MAFSFGFEPDEPMAAAAYGEWLSQLLFLAPAEYHVDGMVEADVLRYVRHLEGALQSIAELDYRGPMPTGTVIARRALGKE